MRPGLPRSDGGSRTPRFWQQVQGAPVQILPSGTPAATNCRRSHRSDRWWSRGRGQSVGTTPEIYGATGAPIVVHLPQMPVRWPQPNPPPGWIPGGQSLHRRAAESVGPYLSTRHARRRWLATAHPPSGWGYSRRSARSGFGRRIRDPPRRWPRQIRRAVRDWQNGEWICCIGTGDPPGQTFRQPGSEPCSSQPIALQFWTDRPVVRPYRTRGGASGGCTWAIMTCFLKIFQHRLVQRTSVGRLASVVMWSILSCSFSRA